MSFSETAPSNLQGRRVAILAAHGFEDRELFGPRQALEEAGAQVDIVSPEPAGTALDAFHQRNRVGQVVVDRAVTDARVGDYQALVIPGGLFSPDTLRTHRACLEFVADFFSEEKPVAAICHGAQVLISAGVVEGRTLTAAKSIQVDLRNAGAHVRDEAAVVDGLLVTSRTPEDLPSFCDQLTRVVAHQHEERHALAA